MSDNDQAMASIVVLDGRENPYDAAVTAAIAGALAEAAASDEDRGSGGDRPSHASPSSADRVLHDADVAVVLDPASLERAREAGVPFCVVVLPGFDLAWSGDLAEADRVIVAHEGLVDEVVRRGAPRGLVDVAAPVAPQGWAPIEDRGAALVAAGLPEDRPLVLVPTACFDEWGLQALMVQLSLAADRVRFLFDVGHDAEIADELRRLAPIHGLSAWMFADEPASKSYWQLADLSLGHARGHEVPRALAVGCPLLLCPPGRTGAYSADVLESVGAADEVPSLAMLSVKLETAVEPDALAEGRKAVEELSVGGGARAVANLVREAWANRDTERHGLLRGLPHGLEALGASEPAADDAPPEAKGRKDDDLEARIDRELEELRKRL